MALSRTPSPAPSCFSTATTLVSTNTGSFLDDNLHPCLERRGDIRMNNLSSEARSLLRTVTELPLLIPKTCGRYKMALAIWGSSPRSLTAIRYRLSIERTSNTTTATDSNSDDNVPLADILIHFEEVAFTDDEEDALFNQLRQPLHLREWLESIDELVDETIRDIRIRSGISTNDDYNS
ncbi:hypothetical protein PV08_02956 [Exophiala spinifera]|uniref:Uncharacterized protein n=1 Tax=Exophiala spinifera TaxID=91928 RepID=A0A0D2A117_9EURO|nr:uncharacterized protein PV08_02956 [Exophiala spinifera]KIW18667.1 hypothetical protein PV08_02956 [Exophiala spinifera]